MSGDQPGRPNRICRRDQPVQQPRNEHTRTHTYISTHLRQTGTRGLPLPWEVGWWDIRGIETVLCLRRFRH